MNSNGKKLLVSRAINKLGDVMYDYSNSAWIASLGGIGQQFLGIYKLAELLVQIIIGPFAGALADRFQRRKILLLTDFISAVMCLAIAILGNQTLMLYGLVVVNGVLAISGVFSQPAYKAFVRDVVGKELIVSYNSTLTSVVQTIKIASPILGFWILQHIGLRLTLLLDSLTFFISFICVLRIKIEKEEVPTSSRVRPQVILHDIWDGLRYTYQHKDIFFLLLIASAGNFFMVMFEYLLPFTSSLLHEKGAYAIFLSVSAVSVLIGSLLSRFMKEGMQPMLWMLIGSSVGIIWIAIPSLAGLPIWLSYGGQVLFKIFEAIFNIHFSSQVQIRVEQVYMGRVFSSVYTVALLLTPFGTLLMTLFPKAIHMMSFVWIGVGTLGVGLIGLLYCRFVLKTE